MCIECMKILLYAFLLTAQLLKLVSLNLVKRTRIFCPVLQFMQHSQLYTILISLYSLHLSMFFCTHSSFSACWKKWVRNPFTFITHWSFQIFPNPRHHHRSLTCQIQSCWSRYWIVCCTQHVLAIIHYIEDLKSKC